MLKYAAACLFMLVGASVAWQGVYLEADYIMPYSVLSQPHVHAG